MTSQPSALFREADNLMSLPRLDEIDLIPARLFFQNGMIGKLP